MKKVIFKIDKDLDFKNHLIMAKTLEKVQGISSDIAAYYKNLREADDAEKIKIFEKESSVFYSDKMKIFRDILVKQTQEMWVLVNDEYIEKMEKIHKKDFPFENISGILTTAPFGYGYDFNESSSWFACSKDAPLKAVHTAMHEIMHAFFHKYFADDLKTKFNLDDKKIWLISEALTVILNLEFDDLRMYPDKGHPGHEELREKIKENWLKYKDLNKVLEEVCASL